MLRVWTDDDKTKIELPCPSEYDWDFEDVDKNSGRNENAKMIRERVAQKTKLTLKWAADKFPKEHAELVRILKSLPPFFYCEYPEPTGNIVSMECYHGPIKANMYRYVSIDHAIYKQYTCNFIER